ncbi:LSM8 homolog, U6 small nuclear RNA associated isoform X1 [Zonotrichia leucophrys gambelii]|uniref:LSM8 homolog, U6 small nuclear RNA associated isoform X1 n=1 Tax=Zonotrichia leucophrys gambelii TaxID=257770 RepID=UPI00314085E2
MTSALENYINRILRRGPPAPQRGSAARARHYMTKCFLNEISGTVAVITSDGRMIVGTLKGFDQTINLILDESHERVFSSSQGVEQVVLGLYIVRGDNVAVIGEIDEETDSALDLGNIRAEPLNSVVH